MERQFIPDEQKSPISSLVIAAIFIFAVSLVVYLLTLAPTVTFVDSGELIVATRFLGVAHPPGFPLYLILTHLATFLPFGNIAHRVNLASALYAGIAITITFLLISQIMIHIQTQESATRKKRSTTKKRQTKQDNLTPTNHNTVAIIVSAALGALVFAFSRTLWSFATVAEVYTLNTMLIALICLLVFRWRVTQNSKLIYSAALLFGLALGVHHVTVGILIPALAVLVFRTAGWQFFKSTKLLYCAVIAIAGTVAIYAYLPLSALNHPVINWGDPQTLQRFWWHVTGHQYQVFFSFSPEQIVNQASQMAGLLAREFSPGWVPLPLALAVIGFTALFARDRSVFWFLILVILADVGYSLNYEIAEDKGAYYLPAFMSLAVAMSFGAHSMLIWLSQRVRHKAPGFIVALALVLIVPLITLSANLPFTSRHNFYLASDYVDNIERPIATGGMLLTSDWQVYSPLLYLHEVEQRRGDVIAIDLNLLRRSWYYDYLKERYRETMTEAHDAVETFLVDLHHWERDPDLYASSPALTRQINDHFHQMIIALIDSHKRKAPVYVTWEVGVGPAEDKELAQTLNEKYRLVPEGLVFRLGSEEDFQNAANPEIVTHRLNDGSFLFTADDVVTLKVLPTYTTMFFNRGRYCEALGLTTEAISAYRRVVQLDPNSQLAQDALTRLANGQNESR